MKNFSILFLALFLAACAAPAANDAAAKPAANSQANALPSLSPTAETAKAETVTIETPDGVKLVGSFYQAKEANSPALLLLHQWTANRHTYDRFAERMNAAGYAVLSIDGRGFGESTKMADGSEIKVDLD